MDLKALEFTELRILSEENKGVAPGPASAKIRGSEIQQRITELTMNAVGYYGISNDLANSNADRIIAINLDQTILKIQQLTI